MKKTLLIITCFIACIAVYGQWATDPAENNQWSPEGVELYNTEVVVNDDGVVYFYYSRPMGGIASHIQIFDKEGNPVFEDWGLKYSHFETASWTQVNNFLFLDSEGNAVICVSDFRNSASSQYSYTAYKISPQGEMLWGDEGVALHPGITYGLSAKLTMTTMEDKSHVFAWIGYEGEDPGAIYMQRISHEGEYLWDDLVRLKDENVQYTYPYLLDGARNQFLLIYTKGSNQDLTAMKYDFDGEPVWPQELIIYQGGFGSVPLWVHVQVISDENGGAFVAWHDDRYFTNFETSFVAHVKSNGEHGFIAGTGGQALAYNAELGVRCMYPKIVYDAENEHLHAIWTEWSSGQSWSQITYQKLNMNGELLFGPEGAILYPFEQLSISYTSIAMAEPGFPTMFIMRNPGDYGVDALAAKIDAEKGELAWEDGFVQIAQTSSTKYDLGTTKLIDGSYWITYWEDARILPETPIRDGVPRPSDKVYAQRLYTDGNPYDAVNIPNVNRAGNSFALYPTVIESSASFLIQNSIAGQVDINIYNMNGQKTANIHSGIMTRGTHEINWNAKQYGLSQGVYLAVITTPDKKETIKFIVK